MIYAISFIISKFTYPTSFQRVTNSRSLLFFILLLYQESRRLLFLNSI